MPDLLLGTNVDLLGLRIFGSSNATTPDGLVTKAQLDAVAVGQQWFAPVRVAATGNHGRTGLAAIDGVTPLAGDRVLLPAQTDAATNGIWVAASGAWARATDADEAGEMRSTRFVAVQEGTANADTNWQLTTDGAITVGTTALTWQKIGSGGTAYVGGNGVTVTGPTIAAKVKASGGVTADGDGLAIDPSFSGLAKRYAADLPAGTSITVTHGLGTLDVTVSVYRKSDGAEVLCAKSRTGANAVVIDLGSNPSAGVYRVVITG